MAQAKKARAIGFNHVALEVGDIDEALAFYGRLFEFELRGRSKTSAFIDLGDQFLAFQKGRPIRQAFFRDQLFECGEPMVIVTRAIVRFTTICHGP